MACMTEDRAREIINHVVANPILSYDMAQGPRDDGSAYRIYNLDEEEDGVSGIGIVLWKEGKEIFRKMGVTPEEAFNILMGY